MKTIKFLLRSMMLIAVVSFGSSFLSESSSVEASSKVASGVSYNQVVNYLQACSHHHIVSSIQPIPCTNNYQAEVDGNSMARVTVANGRITGHSDVQGAIVIVSDPGGR
jgi:hypothetical protein